VELRPHDTAEVVSKLSRSLGSASSVTFATVSEGGGIVRSRPSQNKPRGVRRAVWVASVTALSGAALIAWIRTGEAPPNNAPNFLAESRSYPPQLVSASLSAAPPPTTLALEPPKSAAQDPPKPPAPLPQASAKLRSRPGSKLAPARGRAASSAQPPRVTVGTFDPANPYAE
jgi:hypothetical protein